MHTSHSFLILTIANILSELLFCNHKLCEVRIFFFFFWGRGGGGGGGGGVEQEFSKSLPAMPLKFWKKKKLSLVIKVL